MNFLRLIFSNIEKMKSSINNNYCLFCRTEIIDKNHFCKELEEIGDKIVDFYFKLEDPEKKEVIEGLNNNIIKNQEFSENIRNKILAYSL